MKKIIITCITSAVDGVEREYTIETDNRDRVRWELAAKRKEWPSPVEAPTLWGTFLAWSALKRTKALPDGVDFEQFLDETTHCESQVQDVDPTQSAATAD